MFYISGHNKSYVLILSQILILATVNTTSDVQQMTYYNAIIIIFF